MGRILKPTFEFRDERGVIREITKDPVWEQLNQQERVKGSVVGNHYHKNMEELFYIINGKINVKICDISSGKKEEFIIKKGDIFKVKPFEAHTLFILKNSSFIVLLSKKFDNNNKDIYPFVLQ